MMNWQEKQKDNWVWESGSIATSSRIRSDQILRDEVYDCAFCRGTGERPKGAKCAVCRGRGKITLNPTAVFCAFCRGKGEEKPRSTVTCPSCKGRGVVSVQEPIQRCPVCHGRGRARGGSLYCIACKGIGVVRIKTNTSGASREVFEDPRGSFGMWRIEG